MYVRTQATLIFIHKTHVEIGRMRKRGNENTTVHSALSLLWECKAQISNIYLSQNMQPKRATKFLHTKKQRETNTV